jgi:preprotein translocase subunit SecD
VLVRSLLFVALSFVAGCGAFGVEHYREALPSSDLAIRFVADDDHPADATMTRLDGTELAIAAGTLVTSDQIEHVRLLDAAEGGQVIVIMLRDAGRDRLREATADAAGRRIAIVAGGHVITAPTIRGPLTESEAYVAVSRPDLERAYEAMTSTAP